MSPPSPLYTLTGAAKIAVETSVRRKRRTVLKIRLNTNGWDETQPLNGVSLQAKTGAKPRPYDQAACRRRSWACRTVIVAGDAGGTGACARPLIDAFENNYDTTLPPL